MGVTLPDLAVASMDEQFGALIAGCLPPCVDRRALGFMDRGRALCARSFHCPSVGVGNDVLIALCHFDYPFSLCDNDGCTNSIR